MHIHLTDKEARYAWEVRCDVAAESSGAVRRDYGFDMPIRDQFEYLGYLGQLAVLKAFGVPGQLRSMQGPGNPDAVVNGMRIEVKSSRRLGAKLILDAKKHHCDVFVLVDGVDPDRLGQVVRLRGWLPRSEATDPQYLVEVPWSASNRYVIPGHCLRPMETLI